MEGLKNPLYKKCVVFDGDSLTEGFPLKGIYSWAKIIGERNEMIRHNFGVGGGTVTADLYRKVLGSARHWLSRSIDTTKERVPELDYLILESGANDADNLKDIPEKFGEYSIDDFSGNYDDNTFTGAVESLFFKAIKHYPNAKIGFIVLHKMGVHESGYGEDCYYRRFLLREIELCKKWGIPYLDLWETTPLNPMLPCYYDPSLDRDANEQKGMAYIDTQHLSTTGYSLVADKIEAWMRTL